MDNATVKYIFMALVLPWGIYDQSLCRNSSQEYSGLEAISAKGDPLETIKKIVPWEDFRADIEAVTETKPEERKSNAGRKPYDTILKFKIVVLQSLHNLSDEQ